MIRGHAFIQNLRRGHYELAVDAGPLFPLGMYAVAGIYLGRAEHLPVVEAVGSVELWIDFAAWVLVFVAMIRYVLRTIFSSTGEPSLV